MFESALVTPSSKSFENSMNSAFSKPAGTVSKLLETVLDWSVSADAGIASVRSAAANARVARCF